MKNKEFYEIFADISTRIDIIVQNIESEINDLETDGYQLRKAVTAGLDELYELENADISELTKGEAFKVDGMFSALKTFLSNLQDFAYDITEVAKDCCYNVHNIYGDIDNINNTIEAELDKDDV